MAERIEKPRNLGRPYFATQIKGRKASCVWPSWGTPFSLAAPEIVSEQLGMEIDSLIGCDQLRGVAVEIDWKGKHVTWSPSTASPEGAIPLVKSGFGVPLLDLKGPTGTAQAIFDTGAPLTYVPADLVARARSHGTHEDFFPGLSEFETNLYQVPITVGTHEFTVARGVLPPLLAMALGLLCPSGYIVGTQLMSDRVTRFDLDGGWIHFAATGA